MTQWQVVGGIDKGGIIVRKGKALSSAQATDRLTTGAVIQEVSVEEDRLQYRLVSGLGPYQGWVSTRVQGKDLLAKLEQPSIDVNNSNAIDAVNQTSSDKQQRTLGIVKRLTKEEAKQMQAELLAAYSMEVFQQKLHSSWRAGKNVASKKLARQKVCLEVQAPIVGKYGFDASFKGVMDSLAAFEEKDVKSDLEIQANNALMMFLIDPDAQALHRETQLSTLSIMCDGEQLCTISLEAAATFRLVKEKIQCRTGIPWQAQILSFDSAISGDVGFNDWELVSAVVERGTIADIRLSRRKPEIVEWLIWVTKESDPRSRNTNKSMSEIPSSLLSNKDFVLPAVQQNIAVLGVASLELREDRRIVSAALELSGQALKFAAPEFCSDREIVLAAVQRNGWALQHASDALKADQEIAFAACSEDGWALQFVAPTLADDRVLVLTALSKDGSAYSQLTSPTLRTEFEIGLAAVRQDPDALEVLEPCLKANREIVLSAVSRRGWALQHAASWLKADREIVLAAVKSNGQAITHAVDSLRDDAEIGLVAVSNKGLMLGALSERLRIDMKIVMAAVRQDFAAIVQVPKELHEAVLQEFGISPASASAWIPVGMPATDARTSGKLPQIIGTKEKIHFETLGLPESVLDKKAIQTHYRRLALQLHPDKNLNDPEGAQRRMAAINHAYQCLKEAMDF